MFIILFPVVVYDDDVVIPVLLFLIVLLQMLDNYTYFDGQNIYQNFIPLLRFCDHWTLYNLADYFHFTKFANIKGMLVFV
jgi:hypothetical protein